MGPVSHSTSWIIEPTCQVPYLSLPSILGLYLSLILHQRFSLGHDYSPILAARACCGA